MAIDMKYCFYFESAKREIHMKDVQACRNCGVPVCSSCRDNNGLCPECFGLDEMRLLARQGLMADYLEKLDKLGIE